MEALINNKHVLVEKPMALSTKHTKEMIKTAKDKNVKLAVCFQNRFNPPIQELRKINKTHLVRFFMLKLQ